ncbi:MAG: UDP-N-acetylglucosamine--N-acetylmuramyl-(pentapeptide) pyrophosphoryl-undecaprenol N-acetylglucosamine transferase [Planctomycetota bacterium]|nr:UDP-N-acetylglucosamine--N-acetylmuramyl-(pentapeptide) pyrophosphoryl-undecaprenol N-acetylglucosamine transferase [Planctomycetota bacterium]
MGTWVESVRVEDEASVVERRRTKEPPSAGKPVRSGLRIAFAGGGTGGHIVPGRHLLAHGGRAVEDVLWFCTGRPVEDKAFAGLAEELGAARLERVALRLEPDGGGAPGLGGLAFRTLPAVRAARAALRAHGSQVLVGLGGFTCLPAVLAARSLGIPVALLEINATRGKATRWLAPFAARVFHAWRGTLPARAGARDLLTGPPLSPSFAAGGVSEETAARARAALGFQPQRPLLVVLGGSQGAGALNTFVAQHAGEFSRQAVQVLHQTGPGRLEQGAGERDGYRKVEFVHDVHTTLAAATLVLCRGGASTLAEVAALRKPAWVVPYPHHADRHQERNARELGLGVEIVDESRLGASFARELVQKTLPSGTRELARRSAELASAMPLDAAQRIWDEVTLIARPVAAESVARA